MILEKLTIHNFGVYRGRHELLLSPPSKRKPVVTIGALNGAGKTTFLDALLLCLYGPLANCSNRAGLNYDEFLRRSINRSVNPKDGAGLTLDFRHTSHGEEMLYTVCRTWRSTGKHIKEDLEVRTGNGDIDPALTEAWPEAVSRFIPSRVANLFLFDGEKIADMAEPEAAAQFLRTAVESLLGIDLLERMATDLTVLERRKRDSMRTPVDRSKIEAAEGELARLEKLRLELQDRASTHGQKRDAATSKLEQIEADYRKRGGALLDQRDALESDLSSKKAHSVRLQDDLRELAAGPLPLSLVQDQLQAVCDVAQAEGDSDFITHFVQQSKERDADLLHFLEKNEVPPPILTRTRERLWTDLAKRSKVAEEENYLGLSADALRRLRQLLSIDLKSSRDAVAVRLHELEQTVDQIDLLESQLARAADADEVSDLAKARTQMQLELQTQEVAANHYNEELSNLQSRIAEQASRVENAIVATADAEHGHSDSQRVIVHIQKMQDTLTKFRDKLVHHHIGRLESYISESYATLMRKRKLVQFVTIDPPDFEVSLTDKNGDVIPLDRLSAGERQLLAVAMLWGLAKASGRPIPVVIDTPLARLDSAHRSKLVSSYFPNASHQVILLSTDEELTGRYWKQIQRHVGRQYTLEYDETSETTQVLEGYFPGEES